MKTRGRRSWSPVAKRAISLPKELDDRLHSLAHDRRQTYSGLIREAVESYLQISEHKKMAEAYAQYYANPGKARGDSELAADFWEISRENWPK